MHPAHHRGAARQLYQHFLAALHKLLIQGPDIHHQASIHLPKENHKRVDRVFKATFWAVPAFIRVDQANGSEPVSRKIG